LVLVAISAGAPLLPKTLLKLGCIPPYVYSLLVSTALEGLESTIVVVTEARESAIRERPDKNSQIKETIVLAASS
jgi:hypothetical protein